MSKTVQKQQSKNSFPGSAQEAGAAGPQLLPFGKPPWNVLALVEPREWGKRNSSWLGAHSRVTGNASVPRLRVPSPPGTRWTYPKTWASPYPNMWLDWELVGLVKPHFKTKPSRVTRDVWNKNKVFKMWCSSFSRLLDVPSLWSKSKTEAESPAAHWGWQQEHSIKCKRRVESVALTLPFKLSQKNRKRGPRGFPGSSLQHFSLAQGTSPVRMLFQILLFKIDKYTDEIRILKTMEPFQGFQLASANVKTTRLCQVRSGIYMHYC